MGTETIETGDLNQIDLIDQEMRRRQLERVDQELEKRSGGALSGVVEPVRAVASGITRTIGGGLAGLGAAAIPGGKTGAEMVESIQSGTYVPQSESGQRNLKRVGDLAEFGLDIARMPIAMAAGVIKAISEGPEAGNEMLQTVMDDGVGPTLGEAVFESTGSPELATAARIVPEGVAEIVGAKGGTKAIRSGSESASRALATIPEKTGEVIEASRAALQTPGRRRIAGMLEEGSSDRSTAGYRLEGPRRPLQLENDGAPDYMKRGRAYAARDPFQKEAIRQGFDEGIVATIREASPADRARMLQMTEIMERGKQNSRFAAVNRPSDVAGQSALDRFNVVLNKNREAGQQLDQVAQSLRGRPVDANSAVNQFLDDLDAIGVQIGDDLKPIFRGSDVEGLSAPEGIITRLVTRMANSGPIDAYELHRLKRFIDENVSFGKAGEGLSGRTESILKNLRRNLDQTLDGSFPEYDRVNTQYADTINVINDVQSSMGRKVDLTGDNAERAIGTSLRRLLSNAQGRQEMLNVLEEMDSVATRYGGQFSDDLLNQVLFADELDNVFGPVARTSLAGELAKGQIPTSQSGVASKALETVVNTAAEKLRGINQENGFKAMRDLLNSFED